ncbi:P-loop containing nucleoside triphosphate hydrolase protein [Catenaria anguillulae PL171]|uniref:Kinesin-like protein n=1 Tax=Catenaria anguillulae PL171 TaxID=765915 RepID=A0A1Y2HMZ8_9FUNG|nr:P-loop containing nucleoside triphosphate hydrolase protein [Catenaria anguillulae PL171]
MDQVDLEQQQPEACNAKEADKFNVLDQPISVALRVRPILDLERQRGVYEGVYVRGHSAHLYHPIQSLFCDLTLESHHFATADTAFGPTHSARDVYEQTTQPLLPFVAQQGGLATVIAYGQTGSGKTFTMSSLQANVAHDVFPHIPEGSTAYLSYFEIYGDTLADLLLPSSSTVATDPNECPMDIDGQEPTANAAPITIRCLPEGTVLFNATQLALHSPEDMLRAIDAGTRNRSTQSTFKNDAGSSRSHAVLVVSIRPTPPSPESVTRSLISRDPLLIGASTLMLVDLAGSERVADQVHHDTQRIKEAQHINKSLGVLKECIRNRHLLWLARSARAKQKHVHVPFRTSKLTMVLREALDPEARVKDTKTVMIGHLAPGLMESEHSLNTARYVCTLKPLPAGSATSKPAAGTAKHPASWSYATLEAKLMHWSGNTARLSTILPNHALTSDAIRQRTLAMAAMYDPAASEAENEARFKEATTSVVTGEFTQVKDMTRAPVWLELYRMPQRELVAKCVEVYRREAKEKGRKVGVAGVRKVEEGAKKAWVEFRKAVAEGHAMGKGAGGGNRVVAEEVGVVLV